MGLSRYPRFGQRIAPAMLHEILDVEIPSGLLPNSAGKFRKLADLDESIWQTASEKNCKLLADLVVKEVHRNLRRLPVMVRISTLPVAVSKIPLAELDLQVRTYNGLKKRFGDEVSTETKIRDLLSIGDLGARSVVDFSHLNLRFAIVISPLDFWDGTETVEKRLGRLEKPLA